MTGGSTLYVVVQKVGLTDFMWTLKRKQSSTGLVETVAASSDHFSEYDQALDAGFVALHDLSALPTSFTGSTTESSNVAHPRKVTAPHRSPCQQTTTLGKALHAIDSFRSFGNTLK